jgi:hypothetical protein
MRGQGEKRKRRGEVRERREDRGEGKRMERDTLE